MRTDETVLRIPAPPDFHFAMTVGSHGWRRLAPFAYHDDSETLSRIHRLPSGDVARLVLADAGDTVAVQVSGAPLNPTIQEQIIADVRRILSMHWDLQPFYQALQGQPRHAWVIEQRAGRMLVSPTVWEDLVKTLFTTNTTWRQTITMTARLCELGTPYSGGGHAFPTPQQVLSLTPEELRAHTRAGYRAPHLYELARRVAAGELDVEAWADPSLPSDTVYRAVRALPGYGDYAAGTMLRLLGHFDRIAIDTECRTAYRRLTGDEAATDAAIRAYYEPYGRWRGLVSWMDIME